MGLVYGLANRVISELTAKIFESPRVLNYIYYTGKEYEDVDLFSLETPSASKLVDKYIFIGPTSAIKFLLKILYHIVRTGAD